MRITFPKHLIEAWFIDRDLEARERLAELALTYATRVLRATSQYHREPIIAQSAAGYAVFLCLQGFDHKRGSFHGYLSMRIRQRVLDDLRLETRYKAPRNRLKRQELRFSDLFDHEDHRMIEQDKISREPGPADSLEYKDLVLALCKSFSGRYKALPMLFSKGLNQLEAAKVYKVTESRISEVMGIWRRRPGQARRLGVCP